MRLERLMEVFILIFKVKVFWDFSNEVEDLQLKILFKQHSSTFFCI